MAINSINSSYSINSYNNITSLFNTLAQGKASIIANKLSDSKFLFPENLAPGKGTMGTDTISYINNLKTSSKDLGSALNSLSGAAFNARGAVSSNTDAMTVKYSGTASGLNNMSDMQVKIDQVAAGQVNEGGALKSNGSYAGERGVNRFSIDVGGKQTQLSVSVSAGDTNKTVQDKMANAINSANLGLKATVDTDSKTGTSTLRVESTTTGSDAKNAFSINDVTGNAVASTGAGQMKSAGQDALYSVNGGAQQTSKSNTINLGNGLTATLKAASDEAVTVSRGKDTSAAVNAIKDMVSSYNSLFSAAAENTGDRKAQNLASRMVSTSNIYSKSLSDIGIGFDNSGRMTIDSEKLNKAAENGSLERMFAQDRGRNYGFANQLSRIAGNVSSNTTAYVSNSVTANAGDVFNYTGLGNQMQLNMLRAGAMFDFLF